MTREHRSTVPELSRRAFMITTGSALAAACGLVGQSHANPQHPQRGGALRFATRSDATGLDPHRNVLYPVSVPLAATSQGLLDLNLQCEPVPGIAAAWEASKDLLTYTFTLRKGAQFHNGREVDAAAVQWNFNRIKDPKTSHAMSRSALMELKEVEVVDKYTIRCHLEQPSASFPASVVYYPCCLIAPDSLDQVDTHPIGCGPFKFVSWDRNQGTELVRFENYFETDAEGKSLPYLERISGRAKQEDRVRLTSLRAGEVDLIDTMAYTDAATFIKQYAGKFQTWDVPMLGTSYILFNVETGPFADKRLRQAAAHAIDHDAIREAVFHGRGDAAKSFYSAASPWYTPEVKPYPEYDPDKAKFLLRQAKATGTDIALVAQDAYPYLKQTGELVQAMWAEVGFKVQLNVYSAPILQQKHRDRDFHAESTSAGYRFDPDRWFSSQLLSTAPSTQQASGFRNPQADELIITARQTADKRQRLARYAEIESVLNDELPLLYLHHLTLLEAGVMDLKGYQPAIAGAFSTQGGGIRTAWLA